MHLLPQFQEHDGQPAVLADGNLFLPGDGGVLQNLAEDAPPDLRFLALQGRLQGSLDIFPQVVVGLHTEAGHRFGNGIGRDFAHRLLLFLGFGKENTVPGDSPSDGVLNGTASQSSYSRSPGLLCPDFSAALLYTRPAFLSSMPDYRDAYG